MNPSRDDSSSSKTAELSTMISACQKCSLRKNCQKPSVPSDLTQSPSNKRVMCLLEQPMDEQGVLFYQKLLRSSGLALNDVYTTTQYKCPLGGRQPTVGQRNACKVWLWKELGIVRPCVVFTFGLNPTTLLLRTKVVLQDVVGKVFVEDYLPAGSTKIVPMFSTHKLLNGPMSQIHEAVELLQEGIR